MVRCAFEYQRRLAPEELQAVKQKGFRIEMWLALDGLPSAQECVLASLDELRLGLDGEGKLYALLPESDLRCNKPLNQDGTIYHVMVESDGHKVRLWVNGKIRDEGKAEHMVQEGLFTAGGATANPGVLLDQMLLSIGPAVSNALPQHPLKPEQDMLCYLPFEADGPGVILRQSSAPLPLHPSLMVEARDRLKALHAVLGKGAAEAFVSFSLPALDPACVTIKPIRPAASLVDVTPRPEDSPFVKSWRTYASLIQTQFPAADFGFNVSASLAQIKRFEEALGHPLTSEFRELFLIGNGQRDKAYSLFLPKESRLLSLDESYKISMELRPFAGKDKDAADLSLLGADFNAGKVRDANYWSAGWIPVATANGAYLCIDYDPTAKGLPGQLITVTPGGAANLLHNASAVKFLASSVHELHEHFVAAVKSGTVKIGPSDSASSDEEE